MTTRVDIESWSAKLRSLADRVDHAEEAEEVVEVADEAAELAARMRAAFPDVRG